MEIKWVSLSGMQSVVADQHLVIEMGLGACTLSRDCYRPFVRGPKLNRNRRVVDELPAFIFCSVCTFRLSFPNAA